MLTLNAKTRKIRGKKTKELRKAGLVPAVLYGPDIKPLDLEISDKEFTKIYHEAGENSLIMLHIEGQKVKALVLIHDVQKEALFGKPIHIDFFQPRLTEKIEARIPVIFDGEAPAVKDLGGTLIKNINEIKVKALPQNLPKEIIINVGGLTSLEKMIKIKDVAVTEEVEILNDPDDIVAQVIEPEKIEEELAKPIEENVEEVEKVEKPKKEEDIHAPDEEIVKK